MANRDSITRRTLLVEAGFLGATSGLWSQALAGAADVGEAKSAVEASPIGKSHLVLGLDAMSRVAGPGGNPFTDGHKAAAVMAAAFFCREQALDGATQSELLTFIESRLVKRTAEPLPIEPADPELVDAFVKELDTGIESLRSSGHNIIFAVTSLKSLREVPEAVTPTRMAGLRAMVRSFGANHVKPVDNRASFVDMADEQKFIGFVMEEYLKALELYLNGKGHHGFAGHLLTIGHALLELAHMGHKETAFKGVEAFWRFVQQARLGANLGGNKVKAGAEEPPTPLVRDYWARQGKRSAGEIVNSHLIKYPYSFYALAKLLRDEELKRRLLERIQFLTATT